MNSWYAVLGLVVGMTLGAWAGNAGGSGLAGAVFGAFIGILFARINKLELKVKDLVASLSTLRSDRERPPETGQETESPSWPGSAEPEDSGPTEPPPDEALPRPTVSQKPDREPSGDKLPVWKSTLRPSLLDRAVKWAKNWITTGNVPVKVGVIISFIGVSFLLKFAIDRELLVIPLKYRLMGVALAGAAMIFIGWRLRDRSRVYALSMQGGGAGILFLTIFAALRIWQLLPASLAFVLLVALTAFTGALAVLQNARSLAILGIVGGFLAPVLTSTGQGSHVVLFSYYLLLNAAILGIAWFRAWRDLNLIGWVFTFLVSGYWGYRYFRPSLFSSTEPFLLLYFLFYQAIAILYALRQPPERLGVVDGTLVFGTPVVAFALQSELVRGTEYGLAISAAVLGLFYAATAAWLFSRKHDYLRMLTESFMALAVAFATLAIPLALDARWTSAAWALEGAALVWVGVRQGRQLANLAGASLIFVSGLALLEHGWRHDIGPPLLNGNVLGGLLISLSGLFASKRLEQVESTAFAALYRLAVTALFLWGALWWVGTGWMEAVDRVWIDKRVPVFMLFTAASTTAAVWLGRAWSWRLMQHASLAFLPMLALLAFMDWAWRDHFLVSAGWLALPAAFAAQVFVLREMDKRGASLAGAWHVCTLLLLTSLVALEVSWWTDRIASDAWAAAAAATTTGIIAMLVWRFRNHPAWPVPAHRPAYFLTSMFLVALQVSSLALLSVFEPGDPDPLPYIPVLNPFGLAMLFAMLTAWLSLSIFRPKPGETGAGSASGFIGLYRIVLAIGFFILTTAALVRGVHHNSSVPWDFDALFDSVIVQTALSIYWGLLGFAGMILGARRSRRALWLTGAFFMGLVVIKLFLVDLGNSGTVERIISFIGVGVLLLIVGYFAPAPPRSATIAESGEPEQPKDPEEKQDKDG